MAAQEASTPFAGTLEERLNKLRGLLDYLPPELPSPAKAEDSRYYPGSSDTWKQLFALERFVRKVCISADNKPLRIAERGAGIMDLIRQIQKCFRTWDSSEFVDKLIAAVYRTCEDGDVKTPLWDRVPPKRPRGRPFSSSQLPPNPQSASASTKRAPSPESPPKKSVEPKTKKRKSNKDTVEPPTSTVFASSSTTSIVQLPPPPASTSSPNVRLRSPSIDKYHYADRTQSKRFWDPHGTVVIQVDAILYRVNATKLSLHSDYFRNNIPENATDDQDTVDNCPVYLVERVTPEDFEALLSLLEDSTQFVLQVQPFQVIASIVRASSTLKFTAIRTWAIREINTKWPCSMPTSGPGHLLDAIGALNLALEYDIPEMIKRLRYEVARVGSEQWVEIARRLTSDHSPDLYLPIEELVLLSIAREALMAQWVAVATTPPVNFGTSRGDDGVVCCEQTPDRLVEWNKLVHESGVFQEWLHDPIYGLDVLSELPWARLGYCKRCIWERKDFWQHEKKRELWDDFDNLLGPESRINICEHSLC